MHNTFNFFLTVINYISKKMTYVCMYEKFNNLIYTFKSCTDIWHFKHICTLILTEDMNLNQGANRHVKNIFFEWLQDTCNCKSKHFRNQTALFQHIITPVVI